MKIAVLLTGISLGDRAKDWKLAKSQIKDKVINCWPSTFDISVYITTYPHSELKELINFYSPKKHQILDYETSDQRITYAKSLEMLIGEDIDLIVSTRFDIDFVYPLSEYPINFNKFNFLFKEGGGWWESHQFTSDNLFIFPKKYLLSLIQSVYSLHSNPVRPQTDLHPTYSRLIPLIGKENTNFLSKKMELSNNNTQYTLLRS